MRGREGASIALDTQGRPRASVRGLLSALQARGYKGAAGESGIVQRQELAAAPGRKHVSSKNGQSDTSALQTRTGVPRHESTDSSQVRSPRP